MNYIDILLTKDGYFCVTPAWTVKEGDFICAPNALGDNKPREVVAVATDEVGGVHFKMIEKYIGYPLPRITEKYSVQSVFWEDENDVQV